MSTRSRNLLLLLGMLAVAVVESACFNDSPTGDSTDKYCQENPTHCTDAPVAR